MSELAIPIFFVKLIVLIVRRSSTVADVARKVMGDAPIAYVEGTGGVRISEDSVVEVGKNDVSILIFILLLLLFHPYLSLITHQLATYGSFTLYLLKLFLLLILVTITD